MEFYVPEELADYGEFLFFFFFDDFGSGRYSAEFGVENDLLDERGLRNVLFFPSVASAVATTSVVTATSGRASGTGKVRAGDLKTVEEKAGALGVDFVAGDATEDHSDGG